MTIANGLIVFHGGSKRISMTILMYRLRNRQKKRITNFGWMPKGKNLFSK